MHETGKSKQRDRNVEPRRRFHQEYSSECNHRRGDEEFCAVYCRLADMGGRPDQHRDHVSDDQPLAPFLGSGETSDGDQSSEMVEPDDRVAETREQPVRECHRHLAAHDMMGERGFHGETERDDDGQPDGFHDHFMPRRFFNISRRH